MALPHVLHSCYIHDVLHALHVQVLQESAPKLHHAGCVHSGSLVAGSLRNELVLAGFGHHSSYLHHVHVHRLDILRMLYQN